MQDIERIICAAIYYDDGKDYLKDNPHKPFNVGKTGVVICGWRHHNCIAILSSLIPDYNNATAGRDNQGFLTNKNRFVDRAEAFLIAKREGQIIHKMFDNDETGILTSEDIY